MELERVTITIESNIGKDGPLTVTDTLNQFKDAFELLAAAISQESGGDKIKWRLEQLSKNSPLPRLPWRILMILTLCLNS